MALHDGKRVLRDSAGKLYKVSPADADRVAQARGWSDASDAEVRARADAKQAEAQYGGAGQTALATVEKAARTATGNLLPMQGDEGARAKVLDATSPVLSFAAQAAGSVLPAAGVGRAVGALGAGKALVAGAEGLAAGYADEAEMARAEERPISAGNVMLFGIGGELAGRAVPALLRRGIRGVSGGTADAASVIAGEAVEDVSAAAQRRATDRMAREAVNMPPSPARGDMLRETAPQQYERAGTALSESLTEAASKTAKLSDASNGLIDDLVPEDSPAQMKWSTDTAMMLEDLARKGDQFTTDPYGVTSKSGRRVGQSWKGLPKEAESVDRRIAAYKDDPEFTDLLQQKAAESRRTPFGPGKERELWELQKDVLEENAKRFPRIDAPPDPSLAPLDDVEMLGKDGMLERVAPKSRRMRSVAPELNKLRTDGIAGKSLADLRALPIEDPNFVQATSESRKKIDWMKSDETFKRTGKLPNERDNGRGGLPSLGIEPAERGGADVMYINNGRHRITAAQESGLEEIVMNVKRYDAEGNTLWDYVGPVRVNPRKAAAEAAATEAAPPVSGAATMRELAQQLLGAKGGADTFKTARRGIAALEEAGAPPEAIKALRDGLAQRELWGRAAEFQDDLERAASKQRSGMAGIEAELDPKRMAQQLELDPADRGAFGAKLQETVEGLEDQVATARKWGLDGHRGLRGLGKLLARAKRALSLAEATAATKAPRLPGAPPSAARELGGEVVETIVDMGLGAMGLPPAAGLAIKAGRRIWRGLGDKGHLAIKNAARQLVRPITDESLDTVRSVAAASAISRFTGDYSGPEEAFAARIKTLDQLRANPTALPLALAESMGTLPQDDPKLFAQLSARVQSQFAYVDANMPPGIAVSVRYPRGMPPSKMALRDYAVLWNSTFYPDTVLDDLAMGVASPTQMRVLRDVHPDVYAQVQSEVMFEAASAFESIRPQTLNQLDILFETDGLAGPSFSWRAAGYVAESREEAAQRAPGAMSGPTATAEQMAPDAGSLHAIRSGVTNRGA